MEGFLFHFAYTYRRQLVIVFIAVFAILGSIAGFVSQANQLSFPVIIFAGSLGGGLFGILTLVCLFGLLEIHYQNK